MSIDSFGSLRPGPGEAARGWVAVPGVDPPWEIPAFVVRGTEPGPTLAVTAGMHAAEYPPIDAVARLCRTADPNAIHGTLIGIPLVNVPGFYERSLYVNPRDGKNVNRVFPGAADGSASERVARFLTDELFAGADAHVDVHAGDLVEALVPFTLYARTGDAALDDRSRAMAAAYGAPYMLGTNVDAVPGAAYAAAASLGVPAMIAEAGQQGIFDRASVERHVSGLRRVMSVAGLVDGDAEPPGGPPREMREFAWLRTDVSATYHPNVAVGDQVEEGQVIGELRDLFGETIRELPSPGSGVVLFLVTSLAVREGDPLLGVGVP